MIPTLSNKKSFALLGLLVLAIIAFPAFVSATLTTPINSGSVPQKVEKLDEKKEPLVMENADRFEGYRSRGEYVLTGNVRFSHGSLRIETDRAVWLKDRNIVYCESGMKIMHKGALLTASHGSYDKSQGQASAEGNVFMRDSSGEVEATGQNIVYLRYKHLTTLTGSPILRRFYKSKDSNGLQIDSLKGLQGVEKPKKFDTLSIQGEKMTYNDSNQIAIAEGKVRINRNKLVITCKKAEYHDVADSLFLLGSPLVVVDENQIKGKVMRLGMHGEDIRSLLVKGEAVAHSVEPATDSTQARNSDVTGDSLFLTFREKNIDSVQVFKNATGTYFDEDKPEYVNTMSGDYMVLRFMGKQITGANVLGSAKSSYYHFEEKKLKGRNDAEGDSIEFAFKAGKVDEVLVKGKAKGTYFGEMAKKSMSVQTVAPVDSLNTGSLSNPILEPTLDPKLKQEIVPVKTNLPSVPQVEKKNLEKPNEQNKNKSRPAPPSKPWRKR